MGPKKILLTGGRSSSTLDLARQLNAAGHYVCSADPAKLHICRASNAISKNFVIPSPRFETKAFIDSMVSIAESEKIDLIIPTYEEVLYLSKHLDRFPKHCQVFCDTFESLHHLHNKWLFHDKQISHGIPAPKAQIVRNQTELNQLRFNGHYALKACYSRASQKIFKVDPAQLVPQIDFEDHNPWIAQEWLEGKRFCTYSICQQGAVKAHSVYPVQFAIDGNSCINFEAIDHKGIKKWVEKFVALENYTGQIGFDFIEQSDGTLYAIECNPRATNGLLLFHSSDRVDRAFTNTSTLSIYPKVGFRKQIAMGMLMYGLKDAYKNKKIGNFFKTLFSVRDVVLNLKDIKPFLFMGILIFVYLYESRKSGLSLPALFINDYNWDGEEFLVSKEKELTSELESLSMVEA